MKKFIALLLFSLLVVIAIVGCTPSEYTNGVKMSHTYPDNTLPIYDDAIVFSYEEDEDDKVSLEFGSTDDIDDISDFYKDLFKDNNDNFIIKSEKDKRDRYRVSGYIVDECMKFKIDIKEASGKYEEKLYESEAEVDVELISQNIIDQIFEKKNNYLLELSHSDNELHITVDDTVFNQNKYYVYVDDSLINY